LKKKRMVGMQEVEHGGRGEGMNVCWNDDMSDKGFVESA